MEDDEQLRSSYSLERWRNSDVTDAPQQELLSSQGEGGSDNSPAVSHSSYADDQQAPLPSLQHSAALQAVPASSLQPAKRADLISFADILNDDLDFDENNYYAIRQVLQNVHCVIGVESAAQA
eukprot:16225-Heterococcus_DN1.PRE.1